MTDRKMKMDIDIDKVVCFEKVVLRSAAATVVFYFWLQPKFSRFRVCRSHWSQAAGPAGIPRFSGLPASYQPNYPLCHCNNAVHAVLDLVSQPILQAAGRLQALARHGCYSWCVRDNDKARCSASPQRALTLTFTPRSRGPEEHEHFSVC